MIAVYFEIYKNEMDWWTDGSNKYSKMLMMESSWWVYGVHCKFFSTLLYV